VELAHQWLGMPRRPRTQAPWLGTSCACGDISVRPGASCACGDGIAVPDGVECPRPEGHAPGRVECPRRRRGCLRDGNLGQLSAHTECQRTGEVHPDAQDRPYIRG